MSSWKPEVKVSNDGKWYGNTLRFATKEEALHNVKSLHNRWTSVREHRVIETEDPVTARWRDNRTEHLK